MNKLIATLIATACAGAMAQYAVYDYSSSIKRLNPEFKKYSSKAKNDGCGVCTPAVKAYVERFAVKSDKVTGYVQLPICASCNASGVLGTLFEGEPEDNNYYANINAGYNEGYAYMLNECAEAEWAQVAPCADYGFYGIAWLTRKNDKFQQSSQYPIYKVVVRAEVGIFGSYVNLTPATCQYDWPIDNGKAATKAWMSLSYAMPDPAAPGMYSTANLVKGTADQYAYGFLGWGNNQGTTVYETGFGTLTSSTTDIFGLCGSSSSSCRIVKQISGTLVGWPTIIAACGRKAIWDLCDFSAASEKAVISGTWSIKYNKSLSGDGTYRSQESAIVKKMGSKKVWDTTDDDNNLYKLYFQPEDIPVLLDDYYDDCDAQP